MQTYPQQEIVEFATGAAQGKVEGLGVVQSPCR